MLSPVQDLPPSLGSSHGVRRLLAPSIPEAFQAAKAPLPLPIPQYPPISYILHILKAPRQPRRLRTERSKVQRAPPWHRTPWHHPGQALHDPEAAVPRHCPEAEAGTAPLWSPEEESTSDSGGESFAPPKTYQYPAYTPDFGASPLVTGQCSGSTGILGVFPRYWSLLPTSHTWWCQKGELPSLPIWQQT